MTFCLLSPKPQESQVFYFPFASNQFQTPQFPASWILRDGAVWKPWLVLHFPGNEKVWEWEALAASHHSHLCNIAAKRKICKHVLYSDRNILRPCAWDKREDMGPLLALYILIMDEVSCGWLKLWGDAAVVSQCFYNLVISILGYTVKLWSAYWNSIITEDIIRMLLMCKEGKKKKGTIILNY